MTGHQIFTGIGRKERLALAARDPRTMQRLLDGLDQAVCADALARCDKYAADLARRPIHNEGNR